MHMPDPSFILSCVGDTEASASASFGFSSDRNRWAPPSGSPGFSECRLVSGLRSPGGSRRKRKDEAVVEASGMEAVERGPVAVVGGMRIQMEQLSGDFSFLSMG
jgi:hypothetical protein